jgi:predicted MPP superfamily phosphohydrolase
LLVFFVILFFAILCLFVYALFIETRMFREVRIEIRSPRSFGGTLEILHISDTHLRERDAAKLKFLRGLHERPVDLVVVTGDMIEDNTGMELCVEALRGFTTTLGIYAVFGAHDHWDTRLWNVVRDLSLGGYRKGEPNDFDRLKRELEAAGIVCLQNESRRVALPKTQREDAVWLVGVDDLFAGLEDFDKALEGVPEDAFRILLTHAIESPEELAALRFDAVFAGHSHGGQVRIPFVGPIITRSSLARKHASGTFKIRGVPFHLNNGVGGGTWTDFRFLCPPEVTYVTLRGDQSEGLEP